MDTKALRQKILDLAIRGKLVQQDPNDEPASVLLERIRAEKQQMVKDGKLKAKDIKNDTIIYLGEDNLHYEKFNDGNVKCIEDEIPFELPEGWAWERLGNVSTIARGASPRPIEKYITDDENGLNWIKIGDTEKDGKYIQRTKEKIRPEGLSKTRYVKSGDFLLTNSMSFGRPYILKTDGCIHDGWLVIGNIETVFNQDFLYYALSSDFMYTTLSLMAAGSTVKNLKSDTVRSVLFPIPPVAEQTRIACYLEKLIGIVDAIITEKKELVQIVGQTKSKILDLAIRGKLVPQDPNDEPASILLERIRAEKEALIKAGKLKRDKKESVIFKGDDNSYYESINGNVALIEGDISFELPSNWIWCRVRNIASVRGGKRLPKGTDFSNSPTDHAYIRVTDMKNRTVNSDNLKYISDDVYEQIKSYTISSKDLYVTIAGTIGVVGEIPDDLDGVNLTENAVKVCDISINKKFLCYVMLSGFVQQQFQDKTHHVAMPKLALERILTTLIPMPPLKEQEKIVDVIEDSFSELDYIQTMLI